MSQKTFAAVVLVASLLCFGVFATFFGRSDSVPKDGASPASSSELLVRPHSPTKGSDSAPVTIVEFLDPECESCRAMHPIVNDVLGQYKDRVRLVIRYMPFHQGSVLAAASLEEARELGKYDEALQLLFERQPTWGSHQEPRPELIATYLAELGIDPARLQPDYVVPKHLWKIERDQADGRALGVRGTPEFFVNGVRLPELGYRPLKQAIEIALSAQRPG
jgi:protein-disulfide isomerase